VEEDVGADIEVETAELLNGGVAGSKNRFCLLVELGFLGLVLPDIREGG